MPIQLSITSPGQAPKLQGTLFKWTNYASGYKARWFVLENGILSYFHNQEDAGNACRGSINMRIAKLWIDSADKQRFDIIGKGSVRYHLKAGHVNEAKRWILALTQTKQWIEETSGDSKLPRASIADSVSVRSSLNLYATLGSDAITSSSSAASTLSRGRAPGSFVGGIDEAGSFNSEARPRSRSTSPSIDDQNTLPHQESFPATVNYLQNQIQLQTEMVDNLVRLHRASELPEDSAAMRFSLGAAEASSSMSTSLRTLLKMVQDRENYWKKILEQESQKRELWESSLKTLSEEQLEMQRLLKKAEDNNKRMKKSRSMRSAKTSGASTPVLAPAMTMIAGAEAIANQSTSTSAPELALTSETATKATPAITIDGASATATPGAPASAPIREVFEVHAPVAAQFPPSTVNIAPVEQQIADSETDYGSEDDESGDEFFDAVGDDDVKGLDDLRNDKDLLPTPPTVPVTVTAPVSSSGSSASVVTSATPTTASTSTGSNEIVPAGGSYISPSFKGYTAKLRDRLPTPQTSLRPDVSLWAILKNSIGKDLSKITLPVYFNEPTSMLQRMAEDAEYIQLLDLAARQRNATERILYVAAFAMSNYSSTIGRVAKPFNPLLGETFEYCREDRQFRYVSEQVSHHPPISACHCDSPNYNFFAEVDVKSKFWGKSFEVMPKGTSHVELKVPKQYAVMSTSLLTDPDDESKFVEHYSWKKVTTCVQNLIVGTPWIDSYGDMIITNHRTGEVCKMTFKARGWRGKDAYEIRGYAQDSTGKEVWEVAGRWNERLVARRSGQNHAGDLGSDAVAAQASGLNDENPNGSPARGKSSSSVAVNPRQVVLLWKRDQVPEGTPFNLTPFAMTLNDLSPELRKHLCPTDSRLRPDQRAMENAQFDLANTEKQRLEEKQRAKRKLLPPGHEVEPRWFKRNPGEEGGWAFVGKRPPVELQGSAKTDGERLGYWDERKRCGATNERPQQLKWDITDDDIF